MPKQDPAPGFLETIVASASRTSSGNTGALPGWGVPSVARVQLEITAFTVLAGNTLDVVVEDTLDGTNWNVVGIFEQKTGNGREVINLSTPFADRLRVRWTIAGVNPAPTFSVVAYSE